MRTREWLGIASLASALTVAVACSSEAARMMGGVMRDAGDALDAAGDAAVNDASAALPPVEVECTRGTWTVTRPWGGAGETSTTVTIHATATAPLPVPESEVAAVLVSLCNVEFAPPPDSCAGDGVACAGDRPLDYYTDALRCQTSIAEFGGGVMRVGCGQITTSTYPPSVSSRSGLIRSRAVFTVITR